MSAIDQIQRLWQHAVWADEAVCAALAAARSVPPEAVREYAHVIGAEETWLARIEQRPSRSPVWPEGPALDVAQLAEQVRDGYARFLAALDDARLTALVSYTNSAGHAFETPLRDILLHVALHGQYHRGKVNLLLRQGGGEPAPVDFIAFARGVAAARQAR